MAHRAVTRTRLTEDGVHGVWLFMLSPLVEAIGVWWMLSTGSMWALIPTVLGGFGFLGGFVLMLIGREQHSSVDEVSR